MIDCLENILMIANVRAEALYGGRFEIREGGYFQRVKGNYDIVFRNGSEKEKSVRIEGDEYIGGNHVFDKEFLMLYNYLRSNGISLIQKETR